MRIYISLNIWKDTCVSGTRYKGECSLKKSNWPLQHHFVLAWGGLSDKHMQTSKFSTGPHKTEGQFTMHTQILELRIH